MKHKSHHHQLQLTTDNNFTWTVFAQLMDKLSYAKCNYYLKPKGRELFTVTLEGEGAYDAGGPFREIVTLAFEELTSMYIDMFIPTPNNKSQSGNDRDKYTINPKANTIKHLNAFVTVAVYGFIGSYCNNVFKLHLTFRPFRSMLGDTFP